MSREEQEAIKNLKHIKQHWKPPKSDELATIEYESICICLNLIDKQQKEIKELQNINCRVSKNLIEIAETCIIKYKVIEKIKKIEFDLFNNNYGEKTKIGLNSQIKVLKELLEED